MSDQNNTTSYYARGFYRLFSGVFGLFLLGVGIYVVFFGVVEPLLRIGAGLLIALLGANAVWSAIQAKASWLSKVGPLP